MVHEPILRLFPVKEHLHHIDQLPNLLICPKSNDTSNNFVGIYYRIITRVSTELNILVLILSHKVSTNTETIGAIKSEISSPTRSFITGGLFNSEQGRDRN